MEKLLGLRKPLSERPQIVVFEWQILSWLMHAQLRIFGNTQPASREDEQASQIKVQTEMLGFCSQAKHDDFTSLLLNCID